MITFYAKLYIVNDNEYYDKVLTRYSIGEYVGDEATIWHITNNTVNCTDLSSSDISYNHANNISRVFEQIAKYYYFSKGYWPILRICVGNKDQYYFEWNHDYPNSIFACLNANEKTQLKYWIQWHPENAWDSGIYSYAFVNADYYGDFMSTEKQLVNGSIYFGNADQTGTPNVNFGDCATAVTYSDETYIDLAGISLGHFETATRVYAYTKRNNGGATALIHKNRINRQTGRPHTGPVLLAYNQQGVDVNISVTPSTQVGLWDVVYRGRNFKAGESARDDITTFSAPFPVVDVSGMYWNTYELEKKTLVASGIKVFDSIASVYYVLDSNINPYEPDVDPDDIPDPDQPPTPQPPDDPDPYYDPTSDPESPDYDPTKDPESPDYDPTEPHTPYNPPSTEGGGGEPSEQPPQDEIPAPSTPPSYVTTNDLFTLYNPSGGDLTNLANFLWSPAWSIDTFKKIFANPLDCILGLMVMPYLSVTTDVKVMNVGNISSGVSMRFFTTQFCDFDCGDFKIEEFYKAYLDYAPYTKVSIFLPYIGDQQLNTDEVMNKNLNVKYRFDLATGDCIAFISVDGTVLYSFSGNCATRLPLSASNYAGLIPSITAAVVGAGSMAAGVPALGAASALAVTSMKQDIRHSGNLSGSAGLMGIQTPYLIITRPRQVNPLEQNSFTGYPSFITESLGGLSGYTEVESCHLEHIPCTDEELKEIETLLKEGVLF